MDVVVELKPFGQFWQLTRNGTVLVCSVERRGAINAAAALLRPELTDPETLTHIKFIGLEVSDLVAPESDPNWKRKGPPVELELFEKAEAYLRTELILADEVALLGEYRIALDAQDFDKALDCLMQLGEWQRCSNPFWRVLEQLAFAVWPTQHMVDRRAKGQRETKIAAIKQRARGRWQPD